MSGKLYVVATPIGNLADMSFRAVDVLKQVDLIAAEDTRHVKMLLQHYAISNKLLSFHQHNEEKMAPQLIEKLIQGESIALVSDAGTPLLSDPGMPLVKLAKQENIDVIPVPGACALIAALSVSGLAMNQFIFEGFVPRTSAARKNYFSQRKKETRTWGFYESSHRILDSLNDLKEVLSGKRRVVVARELTKLYETVLNDSLEDILRKMSQDQNSQKGEFVVLVDGAKLESNNNELTEEQLRILKVLMQQSSLKSAVSMATEITGARKKVLYQAALEVEKNIE